MISAASDRFGWTLDLPEIARVWRAGCIIRSRLLDDLSAALRDGSLHDHLVLAPLMADMLNASVPALRRVVSAAVLSGLPVPSLSAALAWHDSLRRARGTTNLIQAQRDFFGAHGFFRLDGSGPIHHDWT